jgi:hypothetical protein
MKLFRRLLILVALVGLGLWIRAVFFPDPEKAIRKKLVYISRLASTAPGEGNITGTAHAWKLANCFTTNTVFNVDSTEASLHETMDRNEIMSLINGLRFATGRSRRVEFLDPSITFNADKTRATVEATLRVDTPSDRNLVVQEVRILFIKAGRDWIIQSVETIKTLSAL